MITTIPRHGLSNWLAVAVVFATLIATPSLAQQAADPGIDQNGQQISQRELYCLQLEQALAGAMQQPGQRTQNPAQIDAQIRKFDGLYQQGQAQAEQSDCYDYFFFSKTFRNTPRCRKIAQQIETAQRSLEQLERERAALAASRPDTSQRDAIVDELARNTCGQQYVQDAKRRHSQNSFAIWGGDNSDSTYDPSLAQPGVGQPLGYATYRTLCVRLCDGYYFPISYATAPQSFAKDASLCTSQCAAPAKLFVYQNPGAEVDTAASLDGLPYTQLPNAWRYRKQLVTGCSCKQVEYDPAASPAGSADAGTSQGHTAESLPWATQQPAEPQPASQDSIGSLLQGAGQNNP